MMEDSGEFPQPRPGCPPAIKDRGKALTGPVKNNMGDASEDTTQCSLGSEYTTARNTRIKYPSIAHFEEDTDPNFDSQKFPSANTNVGRRARQHASQNTDLNRKRIWRGARVKRQTKSLTPFEIQKASNYKVPWLYQELIGKTGPHQGEDYGVGSSRWRITLSGLTAMQILANGAAPRSQRLHSPEHLSTSVPRWRSEEMRMDECIMCQSPIQ
ncbi:hypothetical protein K438DRAFT_1767874 [Mycena galopus ATCC 62051]|nr:hypothetical protein K438DRAFT_1767874 [Mycena galopus ATCC 62051]